MRAEQNSSSEIYNHLSSSTHWLHALPSKTRDVPITFFVPESESESFDFEYLPIPSPDPMLWQCINAVPSNLHILLQALDFHLQINLSSRREKAKGECLKCPIILLALASVSVTLGWESRPSCTTSWRVCATQRILCTPVSSMAFCIFCALSSRPTVKRS